MWLRLMFTFVIWGVSILIAITYGGLAAWYIASAVSAVICYLIIAYNASMQRIEAEVTIAQEHYHTNEQAEITLIVKDASWFPCAWIAIEQTWHNVTKQRIRTFRKLVFPLYRQKHISTYHITRLQRGEYASHQLVFVTGDLFGFFTKRRTVDIAAKFSVFPDMLDIPLELARHMQGTEASPARLLRDTQEMSSVRTYVSGDPLNRIHWKASAKANGLKTRESERYESHEVAIVLDACLLSYTADHPISLFDKCVEITASLMQYAYRQAMPTSLFCSDTDYSCLIHSEVTMLDSVSLHETMSRLSRIRAEGTAAFHTFLAEITTTLQDHTTLLCVTAHLDEALLMTFQQLRNEGFNIVVMLAYRTAALTWQQNYLKQRIEGIGCSFYSIRHALLEELDEGRNDYGAKSVRKRKRAAKKDSKQFDKQVG